MHTSKCGNVLFSGDFAISIFIHNRNPCSSLANIRFPFMYFGKVKVADSIEALLKCFYYDGKHCYLIQFNCCFLSQLKLEKTNKSSISTLRLFLHRFHSYSPFFYSIFYFVFASSSLPFQPPTRASLGSAGAPCIIDSPRQGCPWESPTSPVASPLL